MGTGFRNTTRLTYVTSHGKYVWIADRGRNFIWAVDTSIDQIANIIPLEGEVSDDPTPDLVAVSPNGSHAFVSLRGPVPLTADPHVSTGSTPGVGILRVTESGRNAVFEAVARVSNIDGTGIERADVHAMTIRIKQRHENCRSTLTAELGCVTLLT